MNILHLSPFVPDIKTNHAGGVCMGKEVETLKKKHNVIVLTFCNNKFEKNLLKNHPDFIYVKASIWTFIGNILLHPLLPHLFAVRASSTYKAQVRKIINREHIDAIHAEYTSMGQYCWVKKEYPNIIFNIVEHDVTKQSYVRQYEETKGIRRLYYGIEKNKIEHFERKYLESADTVFTLNDKDAHLIQSEYSLNNTKVINPYYGVDFISHNSVSKVHNSICFVGQMGREENNIAALRLIKIFKEMNRDDYYLTIIGAHPKVELLKEESDNIHITGFVDDINKEIEKNEIAVFPLSYGAGIKLKVLLSFGLGLPVITSDIGAEGIDPKGKVLVLADSDEEYKNAISRLLSNQSYLQKKSYESREFVLKNFGWVKTEKIFEDVYRHE